MPEPRKARPLAVVALILAAALGAIVASVRKVRGR